MHSDNILAVALSHVRVNSDLRQSYCHHVTVHGGKGTLYNVAF